MTTIAIEEIQSPEAFVMCRLARRIGVNIRPGEAVYDKERLLWKVPLRAVVTSQVAPKDRPSKRFVYDFKNIAEALVEQDGDQYHMRHFPNAEFLEDYLVREFDTLTEKIENVILSYDNEVWGQFTYVRTFLRPVYDIVTNALTERKLSLDFIEQTGKHSGHYVQMLLDMGLLEIDENQPRQVRASNELTRLHERVYRFDTKFDVFNVASAVAGRIFSSQYRRIRNEFKIYSPTAYVDATKAYYLDAVRMGERIPMTEKELYQKFRIVGHRNPYESKNFKFKTIISEVVGGKLLERDADDNVIGSKSIFDKVMPFQDEIVKAAPEI